VSVTLRDRLPPHSLEAESALRGSAMIDRHVLDLAVELLEPDDFYAPVHETICLTMRDLWQAGQPSTGSPWLPVCANATSSNESAARPTSAV
jgi:hypothetical protein